MKLILLSALFSLAIMGCANLYKYQMSDIIQSEGKLTPIDLKVSALGFDIEEAASVAKLATRTKAGKDKINDIKNIISLFQFGPKTGKPTFSDDYADRLYSDLVKNCPSRQLTGIQILREQADYPVVSGEIVRVLAYCIEPTPETTTAETHQELEEKQIHETNE